MVGDAPERGDAREYGVRLRYVISSCLTPRQLTQLRSGEAAHLSSSIPRQGVVPKALVRTLNWLLLLTVAAVAIREGEKTRQNSD